MSRLSPILFSSEPIARRSTPLSGGTNTSGVLFQAPQSPPTDEVKVNFESPEDEDSGRVDTLLGSLKESVQTTPLQTPGLEPSDNALQRFQKRYARGLGDLVSGAVGVGSDLTEAARNAAFQAPGALLRASGEALEWADFPETAGAARRLGSDADATLSPVNETLNQIQQDSVRGLRSGIESNFQAVGEMAAHPRRTVEGVVEAVSDPVGAARDAATGTWNEVKQQYEQGGVAQVGGWATAQAAPGLGLTRRAPRVAGETPKPGPLNTPPAGTTPPAADKLLRHSSEQARRQAVVVGGGPGGLRAALELASRDVDVTVLESRAARNADAPAHLRPHQISLRQESLASLEGVGAKVNSSPLQADVTTQRQGLFGRSIVEQRPNLRRPAGAPDDPNLLRGDSVAQARISDVERSLLEQAKAKGISIRSGYDGVLEKDGDSYAVRGKGRDGREDLDLGTPDLVVVADGANSPTRASLGIPLLEQSAPEYNVGIAVDRGIGPENRKLRQGNRYTMATGHSEHDATWISSRLSDREYRRGQADSAAFTQAALKHARRVTGDRSLTEENIIWGAGESTVIQNRRAQQMTAGDNVLLYGDATGTGSPLAGGGLNLALTTHAGALGRVADQLQDSPRSVVFRDYTERVNAGLDVWHEMSEAYKK